MTLIASCLEHDDILKIKTLIKLRVQNDYCHLSCFAGQRVEKQVAAGESSFALSSLETGKRYMVTIIAYRGNKRSKVVETVFRTGLSLNPQTTQ